MKDMLLTVQLTHFGILGVTEDNLRLKYKSVKMTAHTFRTEVKNE
jgi:hypothetical protein